MNHDSANAPANPTPVSPPPQDVSQFSLLDLFCLEVNTQIAVFNHELLNLELCQNRDAALEALMRAAHSIKGAARIVQIEVGVTIAHELEEYFVAAQAGRIVPTTEHVDVLLGGGDLLLAIATQLETQQGVLTSDAPEVQAYLQALKPLMQAPIAGAIEPVVKPIVEQIIEPIVEQIIEHVVKPIVEPIIEPALEVIPEVTRSSVDRTVRLSAEHLHRLMDLAGESLVSANGLQQFADSFMRLKAQQSELNRMLDQVRGATASTQTIQEKLALACQKAQECQQAVLDRQSEFDRFSQKSNQLADRLYREVIASQMRPFSDIGQGFPRMVRDLAKQLGKQVQLVVTGQNTLVDRDILDRLETPLTHLLCNAIDHAIEPPDQRQSMGKTPHGTLHLEASHRAGVLFITVRDDGAGIDLPQLRDRIVAKQLTTAAMAAQMSEAELLEFLYLPGFSTATQVTAVSGRGVGLDIVRNMVQSVGGSLRTTTQLGQGTTFHLQLPLTLSVIRTLLVQIAGDPYALPLSRVDRIVTMPADQIIFSASQPYVIHNQQTIGIMPAAAVLGFPAAQSESALLTLIVIHDRTNHYGLIIDQVLGEQSLVVRALDQRLGKVPNISAAALLNDGTPLLIVDVDDLLRSLEKQVANGSANHFSPIASAAQQLPQKRILVVDDSITVREMERKLLENAGYHVDVAVDGMDGWNAAQMGQYDLIVTDVDMPRLSGVELVQQLKSHITLRSIPTIIISYKDREVDRIAGLEAGADYYLTKSSFHDDTLLQAVTDLIGSGVG
jgi:two-component system, chemotaxis family, sensor histidine kinase and response regulator WspE